MRSLNAIDSLVAPWQALASQPVLRRDVVTPYASFPLLLHNVSAGLCWCESP